MILVDNTAAIKLAQNPEFHRHTKHIIIKHFFLRKVLEKYLLVLVQQVSTEYQTADMMNKTLFYPSLIFLSQDTTLVTFFIVISF